MLKRTGFLVGLIMAILLLVVMPVRRADAASWQDAGVPETTWYATQTGLGQGGAVDPYVIDTEAELAGLASLVNAGNSFVNKYIRLDADLDLAGRTWQMIGTNSNRFKGNFDGNGHVIKNMTHYATTWEEFGLFGWINTNSGPVTIKNLGLVEVNVDGLITMGGGLVGYWGIDGFSGSSSLTGCFVTGRIHSAANTGELGGLIGQLSLINASNTSLTISDCFSTCDLALTSANNEAWYTRYVGGLLGQIHHYGGTNLTLAVSNCYAAGRVTTANSGRSLLGAVVGMVNTTSQITMTDCLFDGQAAGVWYGFDQDSVTFAGVTAQTTSQMTGVGAIPAAWSGLVWQARAGLYPRLAAFDAVPASVAAESSLAGVMPVFLLENVSVPALSDNVAMVRHDFIVPLTDGATWSALPPGILAIDNGTGQVTMTSPPVDTEVMMTALRPSGALKNIEVLVKAGVNPGDVTPPTVAIDNVTPADLSAVLEISSDESADLFVLVLLNTDPAPANGGEIIIDSHVAHGFGTTYTPTISGLMHSTDYIVYAVGIDPTGNVSNIVSTTFTTMQDQTPPNWSGNTSVTFAGTIASFSMSYDEAGTIRFVVEPSGTGTPSNDQVAAGLNSLGNPAYYSDQTAYNTAGNWRNSSFETSGYPAGTYKIYVICEDAYLNRSTVRTLSFTINQSSAKEITDFTVPGQVGVTIIDGGGHTVTFHLYTNADVTALIPAITVSALATVSPLSGAVQDFTAPVTYTVTAEDTTNQAWTVTAVKDIPLPISSTTLALTAGTNPAHVGDSLTFTATVTSGATGTVDFSEGATTFCSAVAIVADQASCDIATLTPGAHTISANYSGDVTHAASADSLAQEIDFLVTPSAGADGAISPSSDQLVGQNQTIAFTLTPDPGYMIDTTGGTCGGNLVGQTYTTDPVIADCTVNATFTYLTAFTVNPASDGDCSDGDCDLASALIAASYVPAEVTITISGNTFLVAATNFYSPGQGGFGSDNHGLIIQGAGAGVTILDGDGTFCPLRIDTTGLADDSAAAIDISAITFQNGYNDVVHEGGGGLAVVTGAAPVAVTDCEFSGNATEGNDTMGGGAWLQSTGGNLTVTSTDFLTNAGVGFDPDGGGAYVRSANGTVAVSDCNFADNSISGQAGIFGGGLMVWADNNTVTVNNNTFKNNRATTDNSGNNDPASGGGLAVYAVTSDVTIDGNDLIGNIASGVIPGAANGGGLGIKVDAGNALITNNLIAGNLSENGAAGGVGVAAGLGNIVITNNTIYGNTAGLVGGGGGIALYYNSSSADIYNNIFWDNEIGVGGPPQALIVALAPVGAPSPDLYVDSDADLDGTGSAVRLYNNDLTTSEVITNTDSFTSGANLSADPLLMGGDPTQINYYYLQVGSPCLNTGANGAPALTLTDFNGHPRIIDGIVDMGAFEVFRPKLTVVISPAGGGTISSLSPPGIDCPGDCEEEYPDGSYIDMYGAANPHYQLDSISGCGGYQMGIQFIIDALSSDCVVTATFTPEQYTVTPSVGVGGSISPVNAQIVDYNTSTDFTIIPAAGFHLVTPVGGTCGGTYTGDPNNATTGVIYTTTAVTADCSVDATFADNQYTVTASAGGGGSINPVGTQTVLHNATPSFTIIPGNGYHLVTPVGGTCTGGYVGNPSDSTSGVVYTTNAIIADCAVAATFAANSVSPPSGSQYTVTPAAGSGGAINPVTPQTVNENEVYSFAVTPDSGYAIQSVSGCGGAMSGAGHYITGPMVADCTVSATFALVPDRDHDGIPDADDLCPDDPENDADGDGVCGDLDAYPYDPGLYRDGILRVDFERTDGIDAVDNLVDGMPSLDVTYHFMAELYYSTTTSVWLILDGYPVRMDCGPEPVNFNARVECTYDTRLGPAGYHEYRVELRGEEEYDPEIDPLLASGNLPGPVIELLNGANMVGLAKALLEEIGLEDLLGSSRIFGWISNGISTAGNNGYFAPYDNNWFNVPGQGYFMHREDLPSLPDLHEYPEYVEPEFTMDLTPGWNIITNPYGGQVLLSEVKVRRNDEDPLAWTGACAGNFLINAIYTYQGDDWGGVYSFESAGAAPDALLIPWRAYWIYVVQDDADYKLIIPNPFTEIAR
ncbi:MAG: Ig-like domain repeat protein [Proteobacteria bacterium]|nr:Ig-like domain repeat protein [Pseudomonadota bacterium]MBU1715097.1 Ig-like domain repeat protein [Pseudomonadota bacterium]